MLRVSVCMLFYQLFMLVKEKEMPFVFKILSILAVIMVMIVPIVLYAVWMSTINWFFFFSTIVIAIVWPLFIRIQFVQWLGK